MTNNKMTAKDITARLTALADPERAKLLQSYFKTGKDEYAQGDVFLGLTVPAIRKLVRVFKDCPHVENLQLLKSPFHEARLLALLLFVRSYQAGTIIEKKRIYTDYLANTRHINNWDLVDLSARQITGAHLADKPRSPLYKLARSKSLWERRIAVISTFHFIAENDYEDALKIAEILIKDKEDLIHKAVGWMLREVGKRDRAVEEAFLRPRYMTMPRTMLRYAIEKFPEKIRKSYLNGTI